MVRRRPGEIGVRDRVARPGDRVVRVEQEPVQRLDLDVVLPAVRPRAADVLRQEAERRAGRGSGLDQVFERIVEVRRPEPEPILPHLLVDAHLPALAVLGHQARVAEPREEQVVDGRRAKALGPPAAQLRADLLHEQRDRHARCERIAVGVVVLPAKTARHEQPVEEADLVLTEHRRGVERLVEDGDVLGREQEGEHAARDALLAAMLEPDGDRVPRRDVEAVDELGLLALRVGLRDGDAERVAGRRGWILAADVVEPLAEADAPAPPVEHRLRVRHVVEPGVGLLLEVRIEDGRATGEGDRQVHLELHVAARERELALPREIVADAAAERRLLRVVVLEAPQVAFGVVAAAGEVEVEPAVRALHVGLLAEGRVAAGLQVHRALHRAGALLGDDVHHAADGVRAVERRLRAAHDLDALDRVERDLRQLRRAEGRALHTHAVHEHLDLVGVGAADADARVAAEPSEALDVHAGDLSHDLLELGVVVRFQLVLADDRHRGAELFARRLDFRRRDDDRLGMFHFRRLLHLLRRGRAHREREGDHGHHRPDHAPLLFCERVGRLLSGQVS